MKQRIYLAPNALTVGLKCRVCVIHEASQYIDRPGIIGTVRVPVCIDCAKDFRDGQTTPCEHFYTPAETGCGVMLVTAGCLACLMFLGFLLCAEAIQWMLK